jgi:hypothetical protein
MVVVTMAGLLLAAPLTLIRGDVRQKGGRVRGRLGGAMLATGLLVGSFSLVSVTESFFHLEDLSVESAQGVLQETTRRSAQGGSEFTAASPGSPVGLVKATATVFFRPFPFELHNAQGRITGLEGVLLIVLFYFSLPRLARLPFELFRRPYVAFVCAYTFAFVYAFSSIENFGILVRQRAQLLPLLLALLCLRRPEDGRERRHPLQRSTTQDWPAMRREGTSLRRPRSSTAGSLSAGPTA